MATIECASGFRQLLHLRPFPQRVLPPHDHQLGLFRVCKLPFLFQDRLSCISIHEGDELLTMKFIGKCLRIAHQHPFQATSTRLLTISPKQSQSIPSSVPKMILGIPLGPSPSSTWYRLVHVKGCAFPMHCFNNGA